MWEGGLGSYWCLLRTFINPETLCLSPCIYYTASSPFTPRQSCPDARPLLWHCSITPLKIPFFLAIHRSSVPYPFHRKWAAEVRGELHLRQHGHAGVRARVRAPGAGQHGEVHAQRQVVPTGALLRPRYAQIPLPASARRSRLLPIPQKHLEGGWRAGISRSGAGLQDSLWDRPGKGGRAVPSCRVTHEVPECARMKILTQFTTSGEFSPLFFAFSSPRTPHSHAQGRCCPLLTVGVFRQGKAPNAEVCAVPCSVSPPLSPGSAEGLSCPLLCPQGSVSPLPLWSTRTSSRGASSSSGPP